MKNKNPKFGYMCAVDYEWELGEALGGTTIYSSVEELKGLRKCVKNCGIVKVEINLVEVIEAGKGWDKTDEAL